MQRQIDSIVTQIEQAKQIVQQWTDASANLSLSAAKARAKNQSVGRGLGGMFLGPKYRAAMRRAATSSNVAIAKDVADKRAKIADAKRSAQEHVKRLQAQLAVAKDRLKSLTRQTKEKSKDKASAAKSTDQSLTLLQKLKEAYNRGLLTEQEYEEKRRKLASQI